MCIESKQFPSQAGFPPPPQNRGGELCPRASTGITPEKTARACALQEMPFVTRASSYDEIQSVAPVEYDNHPSLDLAERSRHNT